MLFDPGSTHSYISPVLAKCIFMNSVGLEDPFLVSIPVEEIILVYRGYRECRIIVGEMETLATLLVLDMSDFDVILGMDWLASCHATLDCREKSVRFNMLGKDCPCVPRR